MSLLSPIWLACLLPWAVLVVMLLRQTPKQINVPFIELWQGTDAPQQPRSRRLPPIHVIAALLAVLLAILAAAGPVVSSQHTPATIIIDRGITMSASADRLDEAIALAAQAGPWDAVDLIPVPGGNAVEPHGGEWEQIARRFPNTALNTRDLLIAAIQARLATAPGPVIVLSDQALPIADPRLIQVSPATSLANVGMVRVSARLSPKPGVMVRLRNQSGEDRATIHIDRVPYPIDLPPRDGEKTYFFDLLDPKPVIHMRIQTPDDLQIDNEAWLVRQQAWPTIETRSPLAPEIARMIEAYEKSRPPGGDSRIAISASEQELGEERGVVALPELSGISRPVSATLHPITENVAAFFPSPGTPGELRGEDSPAKGTWTPIVTAGGKPLISIREEPARQVRVHFNSPEFASTPDFVILWTNIFDWISPGEPDYVSSPIHQLAPEWKPVEPPGGDFWPGVYRRHDGTLMAMNAMDVRLNPLPITAANANTDRVPIEHKDARLMAKSLLLACFLTIILAIITWPRTYSANPPARV